LAGGLPLFGGGSVLSRRCLAVGQHWGHWALKCPALAAAWAFLRNRKRSVKWHTLDASPAELFGGEGRRVAAELAEGVSGGALLGFLLVASPGGLIAIGADLRGDLEALAVVGPFFIEQLIGGRGAVLALGELLQERLVIAAGLSFGG
jgi:hypothetical protein